MAIEEMTEMPRSLGEAANRADHCRRCSLWEPATQTVFGEGKEAARVMFVGEQPGDQEDLAGRPFVGPAGRLFDRAMEFAGIDRSRAYVTNAVKHFKFEPRGKRRIHAKPNLGEIKACKWWLDIERALIKPSLIVALGATAVRSVLGYSASITSLRGKVMEEEDGTKAIVTVHPSFLLRLPDEVSKRQEFERFVGDLRMIAELEPSIRAKRSAA